MYTDALHLPSATYHSNDTSTTTVWNKTDGSSEWESKGIQMTHEGDFIACWGKGTGKPTGPTSQMWEGEMHFMTQSPKLAWMNTATWLRRLRFAGQLAQSARLDPLRLAKGFGVALEDDSGLADALLSVLVDGGAPTSLRDAVVEAARSCGAGASAEARARVAVRFVLSLPEAQIG